MARGSVGKGGDIDYLTGKSGQATGEYYFGKAGGAGGNEPTGVWYGSGATKLGLHGEIDTAQWKAFIGDRRDPRDPLFADEEQGAFAARFGSNAVKVGKAVEDQVQEKLRSLGRTWTPEEESQLRLRLEMQVRSATPLYFDATYSAQKSVSVAWLIAGRASQDARMAGDATRAAFWGVRQEEADAAVLAGAKAMHDFIAEHAGYTRAGHHGGNSGSAQWVDAHDLAVALFHQHTSQSGDPQQHVHGAIAPYVVDADDKVRALDHYLIYKSVHAGAALGNLVMMNKLSESSWRAQWVEGQHGMEMEGIKQAWMDAHSERSKAAGSVADRRIKSYEAKVGRRATPNEAAGIMQQAVLQTRGKAVKESWDEFYDRLEQRSYSLAIGGLREMAASMEHPRLAPEVQVLAEKLITDFAVTKAQTGSPSWNKVDLYKHVADELAAQNAVLGTSDPVQIDKLVWGLVDQGIKSGKVGMVSGWELPVTTPSSMRREDGSSRFEKPEAVAARFVTYGHMDAEAALFAAARQTDRTKVDEATAKAWVASWNEANGDRKFSASQEQAFVGVLSSGATLSNVVGLAGAGKSFLVARVSEAWPELTGGRVIGLATSNRATQVLREEGVKHAWNVTQFLNGQERLKGGSQSPHDAALALKSNDMVFVDESSMSSTSDLDGVLAAVQGANARMTPTGDPAQAGPVEAGGMFAALVERGVHTYTLTEVMRFTQEWEGPASARVRDGDSTVAREYAKRARIVETKTIEDAQREAAERYVEQRLLGRTAIVSVASNEMAGEIAGMIRERFLELGYATDADGTVILGRDSNAAGVGDRVMARENDYQAGVTNRVTYTLTAVKDDGSITVVNEATGQLHSLPATYVADHTQLGYAGTVHAVQGVTIDGGNYTIPIGMDKHLLYPALTRSRNENIVIVPTLKQDERGKVLEDEPERSGEAILAELIEKDSSVLTAHQEVDQYVRQTWGMENLQGRTEAIFADANRMRVEKWLDDLRDQGTISQAVRERFDKEESGTAVLGFHLRTIEQAGGDAQEALALAAKESYGTARSVAQVTIARLTSGSDGVPAVPILTAGDTPAGLSEEHVQALTELNDLKADRKRELGEQQAQEPASWARQFLGDVPDDALARADWEARAGQIAAYREGKGITSDVDLLGRAPGVSQTETRAEWHAAWEAAGRPPALAQESEMTEGQLLIRVEAQKRAQAHGPDHVDGALQATSQRVLDLDRVQAQAHAASDEAGVDQAKERSVESKVAQAELEVAAQAREEYVAAQAATAEAGDRARAEMNRRGMVEPVMDDPVTPQGWLERDAQAREQEEAEREKADLEQLEVLEEEDIYDEDAANHNAGVARDSEGVDRSPSVQMIPAQRRSESYTAVEEIDDLARARSLQAAQESMREEAYLRAQQEEYMRQEASEVRQESGMDAQASPVEDEIRKRVEVATG